MRPPRQAQRTKSLHGWRGRMLGPLCEETGVSAVCLLPALDAPLCSSGKCRRLRRRQETQPTRSESSFSERTLFPPALPLRAGSLTCTYAHMHPHTCTHVHARTHICKSTTHVCAQIQSHTHMHTCARTHAHTHMHTRVHTPTEAHMHTHGRGAGTGRGGVISWAFLRDASGPF